MVDESSRPDHYPRRLIRHALRAVGKNGGDRRRGNTVFTQNSVELPQECVLLDRDRCENAGLTAALSFKHYATQSDSFACGEWNISEERTLKEVTHEEPPESLVLGDCAEPRESNSLEKFMPLQTFQGIQKEG